MASSIGGAVPALPRAYLEVHIEGGTKLEAAGMRFGAFGRYWGATKVRLAFLGEQAHTGLTPMAERHDAPARRSASDRGATGNGGACRPELHTSVGRLEVSPDSPPTWCRARRSAS